MSELIKARYTFIFPGTHHHLLPRRTLENMNTRIDIIGSTAWRKLKAVSDSP